MGSSRHEKEAMAAAGHCFGRLVPLALLVDVALAVNRNREPVSLVDDAEVPVSLRGVEGLPCTIGAKEVAADNNAVELVPGVLGQRGIKVRRAELDEVELKALRQFANPLGSEAGRRDHENAVTGATKDQLLHVQTGHDCLASTWVIGKQVPKPRLT